jgi:hypothetical protein
VNGVLTVYTEDFEVLNELHGLQEARQIFLYPGFVFVITGEGFIEKFDSETLELLGSYMIGQPSPAGYSLCAFSPRENTLYVTGSLGNIIEVSIPDCSVVDEFTVCSSPTGISATNTYPAYLYVIDGSTNTVLVVRCSTNTLAAYKEIVGETFCIETSESDTTLVGTEVGCCVLCLSPSGALYTSNPQALNSEFHELEYFAWSGVFAAVTSGTLGVIEVIEDPELHTPAIAWDPVVSIAGTYHMLACDQNRYCYVASYLGNSVFRLIQFDMTFRCVTDQIDIIGNPLDFAVSGNGLIYVLSQEN